MSSLNRDSSWVVIRRATGEVLFETFSAKTAAAVNREAYDVIPILVAYLQSINGRQRAPC
jgi:hypothetical protein